MWISHRNRFIFSILFRFLENGYKSTWTPTIQPWVYIVDHMWITKHGLIANSNGGCDTVCDIIKKIHLLQHPYALSIGIYMFNISQNDPVNPIHVGKKINSSMEHGFCTPSVTTTPPIMANPPDCGWQKSCTTLDGWSPINHIDKQAITLCRISSIHCSCYSWFIKPLPVLVDWRFALALTPHWITGLSNSRIMAILSSGTRSCVRTH